MDGNTIESDKEIHNGLFKHAECSRDCTSSALKHIIIIDHPKML